MEQCDFTTKLLGRKDQNIKMVDYLNLATHKEIMACLDYDTPPCPACKGQMGKYDFQKASKIPYLETAGYNLFESESVAETSLVQKNHQIATAVKQKSAQLLIERHAMTDIAHKRAISTSTVIRKLNEFKFETNWDNLPEVMSWDEYRCKKGKMSFIAQNFDTNETLAILDRFV